MRYLKKTNWLILFFTTMTCVLTILNTFTLVQMFKTVMEFEPVKIEYVQQVETTVPETTEATEATEESVPETTVETEPAERMVSIDCPLDYETQQMIHKKSEEYGVDFSIVMGVIFRESVFDPNAIGDGGNSVGLMQINKVNHKWLSKELGITDFLDPEQNVTAGIYILRQYFDKYETPRLVLMAYNMGESGARNLWEQGIYTSDYAETVIRQAEIYSKQIEERMGE